MRRSSASVRSKMAETYLVICQASGVTSKNGGKMCEAHRQTSILKWRKDMRHSSPESHSKKWQENARR